MVPAKSEEVVVHGGDGYGPTDSKGRQVLKPVFRQETKLSPVLIAGILGAIVMVIVVALAIRFQGYEPGEFPLAVLVGGAIVLGPGLALGGYTFLRDQETEPYTGSEFWIRGGVCGVLYAATWAMMYLIPMAGFDYTVATSTVTLGLMAAIGGGVALASYEMEYLMGIVHFGLFLIVCLALRWIIGLSVVPVEIG